MPDGETLARIYPFRWLPNTLRMITARYSELIPGKSLLNGVVDVIYCYYR